MTGTLCACKFNIHNPYVTVYMSDPTNQEHTPVATRSRLISTPRLNSTRVSLPSIRRVVRHEIKDYHCRKMAQEAIGRMTKIFHEMNGGELEREHRFAQSQLLDEFDVFQQDAEIRMPRDPLEQVEGVDDDA